jgi:hypothetical protein
MSIRVVSMYFKLIPIWQDRKYKCSSSWIDLNNSGEGYYQSIYNFFILHSALLIIWAII